MGAESVQTGVDKPNGICYTLNMKNNHRNAKKRKINRYGIANGYLKLLEAILKK